MYLMSSRYIINDFIFLPFCDYATEKDMIFGISQYNKFKLHVAKHIMFEI